MNDSELRRACGIVAHKDVQPLRRAMFAQLSLRTPALRAVSAIWHRLDAAGRAALLAPLALGCFVGTRLPRREADVLSVWRYPNEKRQIDVVARRVPALRVESITLRAPDLRGAGFASPPGVRECARLLAEHAAGGDFLVAAEVACTVGYYARMLPFVERSASTTVLVSSDTNPYAVALVHAARRAGKKTCFVTHGHVAEGPPPLDFDLSLLDGPAVQEVYERTGPIRGRVVYKGSEGTVRPMRTAQLRGRVHTLGVVTSILVDWRRAGALVDRVRRRLAPETTVLRLHPNRTMLARDWAEHVSLEGVRVSQGDRPLTEDVEGCDLVIAANTSAHLTTLKHGVPTVYLPGLDEVGDDYYGFAAARIVAQAKDADAIDPPAVARFYEDAEWPARFARFDAGYPDRQAACDRAVTDAISRLVGERAP